jgi:hypothetical protein
MPIYSYICRKHEDPKPFEKFTMSSNGLSLTTAPCPECGKPAARFYPGQAVTGYWPTRSRKR